MKTPKLPSTLTELIYSFCGSEQAMISIYEMGRGIQAVDNKFFNHFEQAKIAWPYPFLQSAWFAVIFNHSSSIKESKESDFHIWFLKFPLDEQGFLSQVARDSFINQFFEQLMALKISAQESETSDKFDQLISESAYGFKPSNEKMANLNAIIKYQIKQLPSSYYNQVLDYFYKEDWESWPELGYQGFADLCCHLHQVHDSKTIEQQLSTSISHLPIEVIRSLSTCLEHHHLSPELSSHITKHALAHIENQEIIIACLRAISHSSLDPDAHLNTEKLNNLLKHCLNSEYRGNIELLAVICGRCWNTLKEPWLMQLFLEALAVNSSGLEAFNIIVRDLLFIPGMRNHVLEGFRNPQRSTELTLAIGDFYSQIST